MNRERYVWFVAGVPFAHSGNLLPLNCKVAPSRPTEPPSRPPSGQNVCTKEMGNMMEMINT